MPASLPGRVATVTAAALGRSRSGVRAVGAPARRGEENLKFKLPFQLELELELRSQSYPLAVIMIARNSVSESAAAACSQAAAMLPWRHGKWRKVATGMTRTTPVVALALTPV